MSLYRNTKQETVYTHTSHPFETADFHGDPAAFSIIVFLKVVHRFQGLQWPLMQVAVRFSHDFPLCVTAYVHDTCIFRAAVVLYISK